MEKIHLRKKTIVEIEINGEEYIVTLDNLALDHFQRTNKIGLLKFYEELDKAKDSGSIEVTQILKLLGSLIREKKTNKIVGYKWLNQFDSMEVIKYLTPALNSALGSNLPEAEVEAEKK